MPEVGKTQMDAQSTFPEFRLVGEGWARKRWEESFTVEQKLMEHQHMRGTPLCPEHTAVDKSKVSRDRKREESALWMMFTV